MVTAWCYASELGFKLLELRATSLLFYVCYHEYYRQTYIYFIDIVRSHFWHVLTRSVYIKKVSLVKLLVRGGLGKLGHFLHFDTVCFPHLSYYTVSCGFAKYIPCQTILTSFYFICIILHGKKCETSGRLGSCLGELSHIEYVGIDASKSTQQKNTTGTI